MRGLSAQDEGYFPSRYCLLALAGLDLIEAGAIITSHFT
jgi:hypothetical protein